MSYSEVMKRIRICYEMLRIYALDEVKKPFSGELKGYIENARQGRIPHWENGTKRETSTMYYSYSTDSKECRDIIREGVRALRGVEKLEYLVILHPIRSAAVVIGVIGSIGTLVWYLSQ